MKKLLEEFPEIHCKILLALYNDKIFVKQKEEIYKSIKRYEKLYNITERLEHKEREKLLNSMEEFVSTVILKLLLLDVMKIFRDKCPESANTQNDIDFKFNEKTLNLYAVGPDKKRVKIENFRKHFLEYLNGD